MSKPTFYLDKAVEVYRHILNKRPNAKPELGDIDWQLRNDIAFHGPEEVSAEEIADLMIHASDHYGHEPNMQDIVRLAREELFNANPNLKPYLVATWGKDLLAPDTP